MIYPYRHIFREPDVGPGSGVLMHLAPGALGKVYSNAEHGVWIDRKVRRASGWIVAR
jgi:hypothetical protein